MIPTPPSSSEATSGQGTRPSLSLDLEKWLPALADTGMVEDQKYQFIEALWSIVVGVLDAENENSSDAPATSTVLRALSAVGRRG